VKKAAVESKTKRNTKGVYDSKRQGNLPLVCTRNHHKRTHRVGGRKRGNSVVRRDLKDGMKREPSVIDLANDFGSKRKRRRPLWGDDDTG